MQPFTVFIRPLQQAVIFCGKQLLFFAASMMEEYIEINFPSSVYWYTCFWFFIAAASVAFLRLCLILSLFFNVCKRFALVMGFRLFSDWFTQRRFSILLSVFIVLIWSICGFVLRIWYKRFSNKSVY